MSIHNNFTLLLLEPTSSNNKPYRPFRFSFFIFHFSFRFQSKSLQPTKMFVRRSLFGTIYRHGLFNQASRIHGSESDRTFHALSHISQNAAHAFPAWYAGTVKNFKGETHLESSILGNLGMNLGLVRVPKNVSLPYAFCCRSYLHSGQQTKFETGWTPRPMDYVQGVPPAFGRDVNGRSPLYPPKLEGNADIVHIKIMRNNAFVTLTDSKGNKKLGISAGKLAGKGGKLTRYSAEAAAEDIGQKVRQMKTKSVVVKVNGCTFFRKKKQAILSFKDGYSHSRGDSNPVVYIEDTTRKPHNGCRLRKKRRI